MSATGAQGAHAPGRGTLPRDGRPEDIKFITLNFFGETRGRVFSGWKSFAGSIREISHGTSSGGFSISMIVMKCKVLDGSFAIDFFLWIVDRKMCFVEWFQVCI